MSSKKGILVLLAFLLWWSFRKQWKEQVSSTIRYDLSSETPWDEEY